MNLPLKHNVSTTQSKTVLGILQYRSDEMLINQQLTGTLKAHINNLEKARAAKVQNQWLIYGRPA